MPTGNGTLVRDTPRPGLLAPVVIEPGRGPRARGGVTEGPHPTTQPHTHPNNRMPTHPRTYTLHTHTTHYTLHNHSHSPIPPYISTSLTHHIITSSLLCLALLPCSAYVLACLPLPASARLLPLPSACLCPCCLSAHHPRSVCPCAARPRSVSPRRLVCRLPSWPVWLGPAPAHSPQWTCVRAHTEIALHASNAAQRGWNCVTVACVRHPGAGPPTALR